MVIVSFKIKVFKISQMKRKTRSSRKGKEIKIKARNVKNRQNSLKVNSAN